LVAYLPALRAGYVWDDDDHFYRNPAVLGLVGWKEIWASNAAIYYPLTLSVWRVLHGLFDVANPLPFHLVTLLLHLANAFLLWRVWSALGLAGGAYLAALFALHPIQVESVAWATELKNTLSGFFVLLTFLAWWRGEARGWAWYAGALGLYVLALAAKPSATMLPPVMALVLWWRGADPCPWRMPWRRLARLAPFFALAVGWSLYTIWEQRHNSNARGAEWDIAALDRLVLAGAVPWFYLRQMVWPVSLTFIYPRWAPDGGDIAWWLPGLGIVALLAVLAGGVSRWGRWPLAAALAYLALLFPVMGFFNVYFFRFAYVADHFAYLPAMVVFGLAAAGVARWLGPAEDLRGSRLASVGALALVYLVLSFRLGLQYRDEQTLWLATLERNPAAWIAHNNLGYDYLMAGESGKAEYHLKASLALSPRNWEGNQSMGMLLAERGAHTEAERHYRLSLEERPENDATHDSLGNSLALQGRSAEAEAAYRQSIALNPGNPSTRMNLARLLVEVERFDEALVELDEARRLDPRDDRLPKIIEQVRAYTGDAPPKP